MNKKLLIPIFVMLSVSVFCQVGRSGNRFGMQNQVRPLELVEVKLDTRYEYQEYVGRIKPYETYDYNTQTDGRITFLVKNRQTVKKGQALFSIKKDSASFLPKVHYTNVSGVVDGIELNNNDYVGNGIKVVKVIDTSTSKIPLYISDRVISVVATQDKFSAFIPREGENKESENFVFDVKKDKVMVEPDYTTGLYQVDFLTNEKLMIGQLAYVKIPFRKLDGIFVRKDQLMREYGINYIYTVENDVVKRVKVQIVDSVGDESLITGLEIGMIIPSGLKGLKEGDKFSESAKRFNDALAQKGK